MLVEVIDEQPGDVLEISFVGDDHEFGLADSGTRLHVPGEVQVVRPSPEYEPPRWAW